MTTLTERLDFPLVEENQDLARVTHNTAMTQLDGFVHLTILDRDLTAPPGGETDGDCYLVAATATGDWASHDGDVALYYSGWTFKTPFEGMRAWIADENKFMVYDGSSWTEVGAGGTSHTLLSATHTDVVSATFQEGDMLVVVDQGSAVYKLQRFAHPGVACRFLHTKTPGVSDPGVEWISLDKTHMPAEVLLTDTDRTITAELDLSGGKIAIRTYAGNPDGTVTATREGEILWDSTNDKLYVAEGASTDWTEITGAGGGASALEDLSDVGTMTEAAGDLLTWTGSEWNKVAMGAANTFLTRNSGGTALEYRALAAADIPSLPTSILTSGQLGVARGGTGLSTVSAGGLLYASALDTLAVLAAGTDGHVLTLSGGMPVWQAASGGASALEDLSDVATMTEAAGDLLIRNASNTAWDRLGVGASTTVLLGGTAPFFGQVANAQVAAGAAIALSKLAALTASRVLVSDGSGVVSASSVTSTTLGYLDATSSIQTQLDAKQGLDATLTALAGVTTAANKLIYADGVDSFATTDLTAFARTLLDDGDAATALATLGAAASSHNHDAAYQALDSDLTALAGISGVNGDLIVRAGGAWTRLAIGDNGHVLKVSSGAPVWQAEGGGTSHALLSATHTDVVAGSPVRGSILVGNATPAWAALALGSSGQFLRSDGTDASWSAIQAGDVPDLSATYATAGHDHAGTYQPLDATLTALAGLTVAANKLVYATAADTFTTCDLTAFARAILDDADAAAVRTTIGAEPTIGTLEVTRGGTGLGTVTAGDLLVADGTDSIAALNPGTEGYYLKIQGGVPVWATGGGGVTDHGALTGLSDDDHSVYALLAGRTGGQSLTGGDGASENLTLASTSNATKGSVRIASGSAFLLPEFSAGSGPGTPATGFGSIWCDDAGDLWFTDDGGTTTELTGAGGGASALDDLSDVTLASVARGDLLVRGASVFGNIAIGTSGKFLRSDGTDPSWQSIAEGDVPSLPSSKITSGSFGIARGGTGLSTIAADRILYTSALDTLAETAISAFGRSLIDDADAGAARTTLGAAAASHEHAGSDITSGTVGVAYGGTGLSTFSAAGALPYSTGATALAALAAGTAGQRLRMNSGATAPEWADEVYCITVTLGNGTDVISGTSHVLAPIPHSGTLTKVELISLDGTSGSISVDIWQDSYANAPATSADSMCTGGTKPNISSSTKGQDTSFTSWASTTVTAGNHLILAVDGTPASVKRVGVALYIKKTA